MFILCSNYAVAIPRFISGRDWKRLRFHISALISYKLQSKLDGVSLRWSGCWQIEHHLYSQYIFRHRGTLIVNANAWHSVSRRIFPALRCGFWAIIGSWVVDQLANGQQLPVYTVHSFVSSILDYSFVGDFRKHVVISTCWSAEFPPLPSVVWT